MYHWKNFPVVLLIESCFEFSMQLLNDVLLIDVPYGIMLSV